MTRSTLNDLNPNEHNQGLYCYLFMISLGGSNGHCNTLDELSTRMCSKYNRRCKFKCL